MSLHFGLAEDVFPAVYRVYNIVRHTYQGKARSFDSPGVAHISYTEMKFSEMSWGVLLALPPRFFALPAKATLVVLTNFHDEPIVRSAGFKTTQEIHLVDLFAFEDTKKGLFSYTELECRYNPVDCKGTAPSLSAGFLEFEGIRLE